MQDKDLAPLRERREWLDAAGQLRGGVSEKSLVQLRTEAKAPFRLTRLIFGSGLLFGAVVGLFIIGARLIQAIQGTSCDVLLPSMMAVHSDFFAKHEATGRRYNVPQKFTHMHTSRQVIQGYAGVCS